MTAHLLMLLTMSPTSPQASPATLRTALRAVPWSAADLREECRQAVVGSLRASAPIQAREVHDLLLCRAAVALAPVLGRSEQVQTLRRLDYCLEQSRLKLERQLNRLAKASAKPSAKSRAATSGLSRPATLGGGAADVRQARQLIALIEAVIQPETWQANGGMGVIQYWSPGYALVIRNTQSAHEDVAGLIRTLEAAR